mmetsp:Transcript_9328/g.34936  ORF Transcript_9328/g.34936 Transcript_9328/m.34936 type:complete len:232 (-) Transcript_9328:667-1362(-)
MMSLLLRSIDSGPIIVSMKATSTLEKDVRAGGERGPTSPQLGKRCSGSLSRAGGITLPSSVFCLFDRGCSLAGALAGPTARLLLLRRVIDRVSRTRSPPASPVCARPRPFPKSNSEDDACVWDSPGICTWSICLLARHSSASDLKSCFRLFISFSSSSQRFRTVLSSFLSWKTSWLLALVAASRSRRRLIRRMSSGWSFLKRSWRNSHMRCPLAPMSLRRPCSSDLTLRKP